MARFIQRTLSRAGSAAILIALATPALATAQAMPEPSTLALLAGGVGAAMLIGKYRGRK